MGILRFVRDLVTGRMNRPLSEWFVVEFDAESVHLKAEPPGQKPWSQEFRWSEIERICFQAEDLTTSDGIYVFTSSRPESYVVPTEASGGQQFWAEVISRGLFDAEIAIEAAGAPSGQFWWPSPPG